jgi:hypothetical protein
VSGVDLVQWLGDRLTEDEELARAAAEEYGAAWTADEAMEGVSSDKGADVVAEPNSPFAFIAAHDPARVLREIEAKRRVLRQHADVRAQVRNPVSAENRRAARVEQGALEDVMRLLAMPYADRPGYRQEWAP